MNWLLAHADVILATAWSAREIWQSKKSTKRKLIESERLAHQAWVREGWDEAMRELKKSSDGVPEQVATWQRKLAQADADLARKKRMQALRG